MTTHCEIEVNTNFILNTVQRTCVTLYEEQVYQNKAMLSRTEVTQHPDTTAKTTTTTYKQCIMLQRTAVKPQDGDSIGLQKETICTCI